MRAPTTTRSGAARWLLLGGALLATLALAGCSTDADTLSETEGLPSLQISLEAHTWLLQPARSAPPVTAGDVPTIAFDGDRVHGQGPCNTFRGEVEYGDDDGLTISTLATSLRGCEPAVARAERSYLAALQRVSSADVPVDHEDTATLTGGGVRLVFHGIDARDELTRTWHVTNTNTGDAITSPISGTDPTVSFSDGGDVSLDAGCNPIAGTWELDGDQLSVGPLRQGRKHCDGTGVMDQEAAMIRALESAARIELAPATLTILDDHGRIALTANAAEGS